VPPVAVALSTVEPLVSTVWGLAVSVTRKGVLLTTRGPTLMLKLVLALSPPGSVAVIVTLTGSGWLGVPDRTRVVASKLNPFAGLMLAL
jgi:hypothetical protein